MESEIFAQVFLVRRVFLLRQPTEVSMESEIFAQVFLVRGVFLEEAIS